MSSVPVTPVSMSRRVLVVEDDPGTQELIRRTLDRAGYQAVTAGSVEEGMIALQHDSADEYLALLLDYQLPDGEPWQLADAAHARVPEVPVVFVTAMSNEEVAIEAVRRGFADYIKKTDGFWSELPAILERVDRMTRMKGRLDQTSALMSAIVEHSSDLVSVANGDGELVYVSPFARMMLGRAPEELMGKPWTEIVVAEDRTTLMGLLVDPRADGTPPASLRLNRKDGALAWAEARVARLKVTSSSQPLIVLTLHDITAQRAHEQQIEASLREKEVLLREVYHRVKNNLQVIQSLLKMRSRLLPEGETRSAIESTIQRIHAMALVHERLYRMEDLATLSLSLYLKDLFNGVVASSSVPQGSVQLHLDTEEIPLSLDVAVPFGLLLNELLSNCLKHGFPAGRRGNVTISLHRIEGAARLAVEDDGIGLPKDFDATACLSMGLKLAASLARQLGGTLHFSSQNGCRIETDLKRL